MSVVKAGEAYRIEQAVWFDEHRYGTTFNSFPHGGEVQIRRGTDGYYWDGSAFVSTVTWKATTFDGVDTTDPHHFYLFIFPATAVDGDTFVLRMRVVGDPSTESLADFTVRDPSLAMVAHQHVGEFSWDSPIGGRGLL